MEFTLWLHHFLFLFGTFSALFTSKIIIYSTWLAYEHEQKKGKIAQRSELLLGMHRLAFHARDQVDKIVLKCDASALVLITSNDVSHIPYSAIFSPIDGVYTLRSLFSIWISCRWRHECDTRVRVGGSPAIYPNTGPLFDQLCICFSRFGKLVVVAVVAAIVFAPWQHISRK